MRGRLRRVVGIGPTLGPLGEQLANFELSKAGEAEVKPRFAQLTDFEREHLEIPAGVERQLVVGEHIGAALRRREVRQDDARQTSSSPSKCAASTRQWPAIMPSSSSISTGLVKPNSRIEAAICATCWSLCVRAFLA